MAESTENRVRAAAEAVRAACLQAAVDGYEQAGFGGLCEEGRWEMVVDAIRSLDVDAIARNALATRPHQAR
ncbi:MAG: hypothetical protein WCZ18_05870 [Ottowia sp.]|nr:hypothetical protein [Ottowia sp.]